MELKRDFHGAALIIKEAGVFTNEEGKEINYDKHIKISVGNQYIKISALQLAGLLHSMQDPEVKAELQTRFKEEKSLISSFGGF